MSAEGPVVLSLGSVNADVQVRVPGLPVGSGAQEAGDLLRTGGGKAANVAVLATRLGHPARLVACVGQDPQADAALDGPRRAGVATDGVRRGAGPTGTSLILVPPGGSKAIVRVPGANDAWPAGPGPAADVAALPAGSVVVVDLEVPPEVVHEAVEAAVQAGLVVVLDPAPPERLRPGLLARVDHVAPDAAEATAITGVDASTPAGALEAARVLVARGVGAAYVKLDGGGCAVVAPCLEALVDAPPGIEPDDATGAGDAFTAALAVAVLEGHEPARAAAWGVAAAACAVVGYGSQEAYPDRARLLAEVARVPAPRPGG